MLGGIRESGVTRTLYQVNDTVNLQTGMGGIHTSQSKRASVNPTLV